MSGWLDYWNGDVSVYVSKRHLVAHYHRLLDDLRPLLPPPPATVLDYGCGDALMTPRLAEQGYRMVLFDQAETRRRTLAGRFGDLPGVAIPGAADEVPGDNDLIVMISVLQYIPRAELPALLRRLHGLLRPGGALLLCDVLDPANSAVADALALLRFGWKQGFLLQAVRGLFHTLFSDYRTRRKTLGLASYAPAELAGLLAEAGFEAERLPRNVGHAQHRYTMRCRKSPSGT